jgi:glucosyl-3-phosphoglycerate synthase
VGLDAIAQVDLGRRAHHNQDTAALGRMAAHVLATVLSRTGSAHDAAALAGELTQFARGEDGRWAPDQRDVSLHERPPMAGVPGYRSPGTQAAALAG